MAEDAKSPPPEHVIEAALFTAGRPLSLGELAAAGGADTGALRKALHRLQAAYRRKAGALEVAKVGGRYALQLRPALREYVLSLAKMEVPPRLLKTLALVAYHQPLRQSDLCEMLGPKIYDHVKDLAAIGLIRAAESGSTKVLTTTHRFAEYFGISTTNKEKIKRLLAERVGVTLKKEETAAVQPPPETPQGQPQPAPAAPGDSMALRRHVSATSESPKVTRREGASEASSCEPVADSEE